MNVGGIKCWGNNEGGQLGNGTTIERLLPVEVIGLGAEAMEVTTGGEHACALTKADGMKCWGWDGSGQLGDGVLLQAQLTAVDVQGLTAGVQTITAGDFHTCAITDSAGLMCWGNNGYGQVGDGSHDHRRTPVAVSGMSAGGTAVVAGFGHTCAVTNEGAMKCWGANHQGQLGIGNPVVRESSTPVNVTGLTNGVTAIAAGRLHTCAITDAAGLMCWGYNASGQLGDGTKTDRLVPVAVSGMSAGVIAVSAGYDHTCALTEDGGVKCWGANDHGQLGDGTTLQRLTPVDVVGLTTGVTDLSAGVFYTCALTEEGQIECWGENHSGQFGNGTTESALVPTGDFNVNCGDGLLNPGEQCEDSNTIDTDDCTNACRNAVCGDGSVRTNIEECDDGNTRDTDGCTNACKNAYCGDGIRWIEVEACDDANTSNSDSCVAGCRPAACGDGFVRLGFEECDDGNTLSGDGCEPTCVAEVCGNGKTQTGEECDDGNITDGDGCSRRCEIQRLCGDATGDNKVLAGDALRTLQRAVGLDVDCPDWICDINDDSRVSAGDALAVLKASVGLPVGLQCGEPTALVLRLVTASVLGSLQVDVNYTGVAGDLPGEGAGVHCDALVPGANYAFNDKPSRVLSMSVLALDGFSGPRSVARCEFTPTANADPEDFLVTVLDATGPSGQPVPGVEVWALPY